MHSRMSYEVSTHLRWHRPGSSDLIAVRYCWVPFHIVILTWCNKPPPPPPPTPPSPNMPPCLNRVQKLTVQKRHTDYPNFHIGIDIRCLARVYHLLWSVRTSV